ncbi:MAG TPA: glycine zipper domain-containing protein, partial [Rhodocyclaceae bacterium]|nr:glycine zipper domain-containing protein [Rhodocyclaceae bacterium]
AAGAAVGQSIGGKTGAIVGAGLGGASGATVGKNIGEPPPAVATTKAPRPDGNLKRAAYDDKKQHRHKKHKKHCDRDHPGQGHAYGKYKHCD